MHDLRGEAPYLHEVADDRKGTRFLQSGPIDDEILCQTHEAMTQGADRYGIEFCRRVAAEVPQNGRRSQVRNPQPDQLVRFACLNVWRFCASKYGRGLGVLGPYGRILQDVTFNKSLEFPDLILARNHLRVDASVEATMAIAPFPVRLAELRFWLFVLSGVQFFLKLDKRILRGANDGFLANFADPVTLVQLDPTLVHDVPILKTLMGNMVGR